MSFSEKVKEFDYMFRFKIVGNSNVEKSCLLLQFTDNKFHLYHNAIIGV